MSTLIFILAVCTAKPSADEIVASADRVRNPKSSFRVSLALIDYHEGLEQTSVTLAVHSKIDLTSSRYQNLVRYEAPARDRGKLVLFNGGNMWFYDPASKASVRISAQQRLIGQAATGDVLTVNLARDYAAELLGSESVQDADRQARDAWHLRLTARADEAVYFRLEAWVEKETHRPIKTKFFSDSGRLLKIAYYRRYETQLGAMRPVEMVIVDALNPRLVTKIVSSNFREERLNDAWFGRDALSRFSED